MNRTRAADTTVVLHATVVDKADALSQMQRRVFRVRKRSGQPIKNSREVLSRWVSSWITATYGNAEGGSLALAGAGLEPRR
jgi:hypothetical protein